MRMRGGGGGGAFDHDGMPHVGVLTATAVVIGFGAVLLMPFRKPAMFTRVLMSAIILLPLTMWVESNPHYSAPYNSGLWSLSCIVAAIWCACATEQPKDKQVKR